VAGHQEAEEDSVVDHQEEEEGAVDHQEVAPALVRDKPQEGPNS